MSRLRIGCDGGLADVPKRRLAGSEPTAGVDLERGAVQLGATGPGSGGKGGHGRANKGARTKGQTGRAVTLTDFITDVSEEPCARFVVGRGGDLRHHPSSGQHPGTQVPG